MTTTDDIFQPLVQALLEARRSRGTTPAPHTVGLEDLVSAYAVSEAVFTATAGGLDAATGYKISLVAPQHRANFGAAEPTFGRFLSTELVLAPATIRLDSMYCPLVEPELVFRIEEDLSPGASPDEVRAKSVVAAGLEIPDSRLLGWAPVPDQTVNDLVADNSFAGLVVHADHWVAPTDVDLVTVECTLSLDGETVGSGRGADVMDDPSNAVAWLSARLAQDDLVLRRGDLVSSGTFAAVPPPAVAGTFVADYSGIGAAAVTFT